MRTPSSLILILAVLPLGGCPDWFAPRPLGPAPRGYDTADEAARRGLAEYVRLVDAQNAKEIGFRDPAEAHRATLGPSLPFDMVAIWQQKLDNYQPGTPTARLLTQMHQRMYPVSVDGITRTAVTVREDNKQWRPIAFGCGPLIVGLDGARTRLASPQHAAEKFLAVRIYETGRAFTGVLDGDELLLSELPRENAMVGPRALADAKDVLGLATTPCANDKDCLKSPDGPFCIKNACGCRIDDNCKGRGNACVNMKCR